jgi:hypothetical protein
VAAAWGRQAQPHFQVRGLQPAGVHPGDQALLVNPSGASSLQKATDDTGVVLTTYG